ncbi:MAG: hypothetical protein WA705_05095 [Candidatus Ozemobacteraceae bacterium]
MSADFSEDDEAACRQYGLGPAIEACQRCPTIARVPAALGDRITVEDFFPVPVAQCLHDYSVCAA